MDAVEFLKQLKRRSKSRPDYYGKELIIDYIDPKSFVAQVESWAKENPAKTRQSEFLKQFPNAEIDHQGILIIDPCDIDKTMHGKDGDCYNDNCENCRCKFWMQEVK